MQEKSRTFIFTAVALALIFGLMAALPTTRPAQAGPALQGGTPDPTAEPTPEKTPVPAPTVAADAYKPDESLGDAVFTIYDPDSATNVFDFRLFCNPASEGANEFESEAVCDVLPLEELLIGPTLSQPGPSALAALWELVTWQLFIDGRQVDLEAFGAADRRTQNDRGLPLFQRTWAVSISNLAPGKYTFTQVLIVRETIGTGPDALRAGSYIVKYKVNVGKENYAVPCGEATPPAVVTPQGAPEGTPGATPGGEPQPGYIGLTFQYESCGGRVVTVPRDGAAFRAGILPDDLIVEVDGVDITEKPGQIFVFRTRQVGDKVMLTVERLGERFTYEITLGPRPRSFDRP